VICGSGQFSPANLTFSVMLKYAETWKEDIFLFMSSPSDSTYEKVMICVFLHTSYFIPSTSENTECWMIVTYT
jgi:hypothetical protein